MQSEKLMTMMGCAEQTCAMKHAGHVRQKNVHTVLLRQDSVATAVLF